MTQDSGTPRTDTVLAFVTMEDCSALTECARQLEQELSQSQAEVERLRRALEEALACLFRAERHATTEIQGDMYRQAIQQARAALADRQETTNERKP